jgi:hypothetical protein
MPVVGRRAFKHQVRSHSAAAAVRHRGGLMQINGRDQGLAQRSIMARIDLVYALSLAASLALAVGAMYVPFFGM